MVEFEKPEESEEVSFVKVGYVYVKSTHVNNADVRAFAVEPPENWHLKLTPEAYIELRVGLAPFELEKLEAARERAADRRKALSLLSERFGSVEVPKKVKRAAERKAAAEFTRWAAALVSRHDPEAVVNRLKALVAKWVEMAKVPNAYDFIYNVMWIWEGDPKTRNVREEWGYWLFREDFKVVKELAERYGIDVMRLWNAYRSAVAKYLDVVTSYGDVVKKAVTTIDVALRTTLVAAGGIAVAEALHGVVRPELVYAATAAASLAMAGKYREAVQRIKTAVDNVKAAVERVAQGVKIAAERLYEAVVEAAARILQMLKEHWRVVAFIATAAAAGLITWVVAQQLGFTLWQDQAAWLAKAGFFGLAWKADSVRWEFAKVEVGRVLPPVIMDLTEAFSTAFNAGASENEKLDAARKFAEGVVATLMYNVLSRGRKLWTRQQVALGGLPRGLAKRWKPPRDKAEALRRAFEELAKFLDEEAERATGAVKAVKTAWEREPPEAIRTERRSGVRGEKYLVKMTGGVRVEFTSGGYVLARGRGFQLKAEFKGGKPEAVQLMLGVRSTAAEGGRALREAVKALYEALPEELRSWLRSDEARAYTVMYELADVIRKKSRAELRTTDLSLLLFYALLKYAEALEQGKPPEAALRRFAVMEVSLTEEGAKPKYYLLTDRAKTTAKKEAIWEAVRKLGVEGLEKVRELPPNLKFWVERVGVGALEEMLGVKLRDLKHEEPISLLEELRIIADAARSPAGLLGLLLGDGTPRYDRIKITVKRGYEDAMKTLVEYSLRAMGVTTKGKEGEEYIKAHTEGIEILKEPARIVADQLTKLRAASLLDILVYSVIGKTPELHKWIRLEILAGLEEAKKAYWSYVGLWPPPEPLLEGKPIKAVVKGLEVYITKWDAEEIRLVVKSSGGSLAVRRLPGRAFTSNAKLAEELGLDAIGAVDDLIRNAAKSGQVAAKREAEEAWEVAKGAPQKSEGELAAEGLVLYRGHGIEVRLAGVDEGGRPIFSLRHAAWTAPAVAKPSEWGGQLRWALYLPPGAPPESLDDVKTALEKIGAPAHRRRNSLEFGTAAAEVLLTLDQQAARLLGTVLLWREDAKIVEVEHKEDSAKYTIALRRGEGWRLYTLRFRKRGEKWEGELNVPQGEAEEVATRLAALLKELAKGTPYEKFADQYQPKPRQGARTQRIYVGGWARELLQSLRGNKSL